MNSQDLRQIQDLLKNELKNFATKDDLKSFSTKDDLKSFATKDDLKNFPTKDDLKNLVTKDDLKATEKRLSDKIEREATDLAEIITSFTEHLDDKKVNKNFHN